MKPGIRARLERLNEMLQMIEERKGPARVHKIRVHGDQDAGQAWEKYWQENERGENVITITCRVI